MIFYIYIRTERIRIFANISLILNGFFCTAKRGYLIVFIAYHYLKDVSMDAIFFQHNLEQRLKVFARDCVEN